MPGSVSAFCAENSPGWLDERIWFVSQSGKITGPISTRELAMVAKKQLLQPDDEIWRIGLPRWFEAGEIGGLLNSPGPTSNERRRS